MKYRNLGDCSEIEKGARALIWGYFKAVIPVNATPEKKSSVRQETGGNRIAEGCNIIQIRDGPTTAGPGIRPLPGHLSV